MNSIYVLRCVSGFYYVGSTKGAYKRIKEHFVGNGSEWTKQNPPVEIEEVFPTKDPFDEDKTVKKYMKKFGIDKVRGGSYSEINLSQETKRFLQREINGASGCCFICGFVDHWAQECSESSEVIDKSNKEVSNDKKLNEYQERFEKVSTLLKKEARFSTFWLIEKTFERLTFYNGSRTTKQDFREDMKSNEKYLEELKISMETKKSACLIFEDDEFLVYGKLRKEDVLSLEKDINIYLKK